jgi:hypothetical protein
VLDLTGVTDFDAGYAHSEAVLSDGTVWGWGHNFGGELGDGTKTPRSRPVQALGVSGATRVAAGVSNSMAVLSDGTLKSWGANAPLDGPGPVLVPGLAPVSQLSAAGTTSLAIVADPAYSIALASAAGSVAAGNTLSVPLTVTGVNGFSGSVTLSATGLPAGVSFTPGQISTGGSTTATFTTSTSTPPGTHQVTVTATNATLFEPVRTATFALTVVPPPPPGFAISLSQTAGTVAAGDTATTTVSLTPVSGFTGAATLTVSGLRPVSVPR